MSIDRTELENLQKQAREGDLVDQLRKHNGWKIVTDLLQAQYKDALEILKTGEDEKENTKARARIKAIEDLLEDLDRSVAVGKNAKDELSKERFKEPEQSDTLPVTG